MKKDATQTPEQLLAAIRAEAATLELKTQPEPEPVPAPLPESADAGDATALLPRKQRYHYREFIPFSEEAFIHNAFHCILRREPDPTGLADYLARLRQGVARPIILLELSRSEEAQPHGVTIRGLFAYRVFHKLQRVRVIRPLARRAFSLYRRISELPGTDEMHQFRASILQQLSSFAGRIRRNEQSQAALLDQFSQQQNRFTALQQQYQQLNQRFANINHKIAYQQQQWARLSPREHPCGQAGTAPPATPSPPGEGDLAAFYVAFEDACRGSREAIRAKLQRWLEALPPPHQASNRVLDIGCGRGEWLQLLNEAGYVTTGIDTNPLMVSSCTAQGLNVLDTDTLAWLKQQPDASLCAITAFHVIEHIPFAQLLRWTTEARRVLQPGGVLIYETPNPENILVGSHTFYHDPTHRNPITPTLLAFLAEYCGYDQTARVRLPPYPDEARVSGSDPLTERVNGHLCGPQDIALVARTPAAAPAADEEVVTA
jgi:O-antigen chain-terminating methyltransferase